MIPVLVIPSFKVKHRCTVFIQTVLPLLSGRASAAKAQQMGEPVLEPATYQNLEKAPCHLVAETLNRQFVTHSRPLPGHARISSVMDDKTGPLFILVIRVPVAGLFLINLNSILVNMFSFLQQTGSPYCGGIIRLGVVLSPASAACREVKAGLALAGISSSALMSAPCAIFCIRAAFPG